MKNKTNAKKEKKKPKFYPGHTLPFIRAMDRWIIPLTFSFMIATLVAYAMEIEGAAKFITLSYPLNGNMFAKGSNDIYFVFFSFCALTVARKVISKCVFEPVSAIFNVRHTRKFVEQGWLIVTSRAPDLPTGSELEFPNQGEAASGASSWASHPKRS